MKVASCAHPAPTNCAQICSRAPGALFPVSLWRPMLGLVLTVVASPIVAHAQEPAVQMRATLDENGQVVIRQGDVLVLQYNFQMITPSAEFLDSVAQNDRRYAVARSNYIHPLWGPHGEMLTRDWAPDHPHHRGIYWAWPEVRYGEERGDLHALQGVFARPVGEPQVAEGEGQASVRARNLWLWRDETPIVFEQVNITAHACEASGMRAIDLEIRLEALRDQVSLARRGTDAYGGLNTRLALIDDLSTRHHADEADATPRRAWSIASGTWHDETQSGERSPVSLAILEHPANPEYPADYAEYLRLPWFQPTFPTAQTRYALVVGRPLVLRYRYLIKCGDLDDPTLAQAWDTYVESTPSEATH